MKVKFSALAVGVVGGLLVFSVIIGAAGALYQQKARLKGIAKYYYKKIINSQKGLEEDRGYFDDWDDAKFVKIIVDPSKKVTDVSPLIYGANLSPQMESEADIINFVRKTGLTSFRFPGGGSPGYHWKEGTSDFEPRYAKAPLSDIRYFVEFCKITGTRPVIQVNVESGTPEEAAAWVAFMKDEADLPVVYWELGNEVYGDWDKAYMSGKQYGELIKKYAAAMKKVDPNAKIGMDWASRTKWFFNTDAVRIAGPFIDFVSIHWYPNNIDPGHMFNGRIHPHPQEVMANYLFVPVIIRQVNEVFRKYNPGRTRPVEVTFLEWDGATDGPASDFAPYSKGVVQWSLANAIFHADVLGMFASHGVSAAALYDFQAIGFGLIRGWDKNAGWGGQRWDGEIVRPKAMALELFSKYFGDVVVASRVLDPPYYFAKKDWAPETFWGKIPYVTAYASIFRDKDKMALVLINKHPDKDYFLKVQLLNSEVLPAGKMYRLTGPSLLAQNEGAPMTVGIKELEVNGLGSEFDFTLPAHSVCLIEMDAAVRSEN